MVPTTLSPAMERHLLFDRCGNEVAHTEVFDEFEDIWELEHDGILYTVIIKKEGTL